MQQRVSSHTTIRAEMANPSEADKQITKEIIQACALVEIRVLDHLVIGAGGTSFSFSENSLM